MIVLAGRPQQLVSWSLTSLCRPQQAVHAGGDDRQCRCGAFFIFIVFAVYCFFLLCSVVAYT